MRVKDWTVAGLARMFAKTVLNPKPTQTCYGCGKPARSGFTFCDSCFARLNESEGVKK